MQVRVWTWIFGSANKRSTNWAHWNTSPGLTPFTLIYWEGYNNHTTIWDKFMNHKPASNMSCVYYFIISFSMYLLNGNEIISIHVCYLILFYSYTFTTCNNEGHQAKCIVLGCSECSASRRYTEWKTHVRTLIWIFLQGVNIIHY